MKKFILVLLGVSLLSGTLYASGERLKGTVTDIEGNAYPTITIGEQEWMSVNLRVTKYLDGTTIQGSIADAGTQGTSKGTCAIYPFREIEGLESDEQVANAYGLLYDWNVIQDNRGICPTGWRVPADEDWKALEGFLLDNHPGISQANLGNKLKSCNKVNSPLGEECNTSRHPRWDDNILGDDQNFGTDDFGFSALPGGARLTDGSFFGVGFLGYWWSSTKYSADYAWHRSLISGNGHLDRSYTSKELGFSVRCVRNIAD